MMTNIYRLFPYNEITEGYNQVINVIHLNYLTSGSTIQLDEVNLEIFRQFKILYVKTHILMFSLLQSNKHCVKRRHL